MMNMTRIFACFMLSASLGLMGCSKSTEEPEPTPVVTTPAEVYVVRGIVRALPDPADPRTELRIHHEHIPDLLGKDGKVHVNRDGTTGMKAMEMPFPLGDGVSLDGIAIGDKVEFELTITRQPRTTFETTRMTKLADDAEISFENKPAPNDDGP